MSRGTSQNRPISARKRWPGSLRAGLLLLPLLAIAAPAQAQQFGVYTKVFEIDGKSDSIVARSLTIFHAGKVYDYLDGVGEVTIHDPVRKQITIVDLGRRITTDLTHDELRRFLALAEDHLKTRLSSASGGDLSPKATELLQFQLAPRFASQVRDNQKGLSLTSPRFRYAVDWTSADNDGTVQAYLDYADTAAMLNSVLHPHAFLPGPRLELNRELRQAGKLPVVVRLSVAAESPLELRVEHQWNWKHTAKDRDQINHWEQLLRSGALRKLPFAEFQRDTLAGTATTRR